MTDHEYDPKLPYVVESRHTRGLIARFAARNYIDDALSPEGVRIIDTTPKPRVPEDAEWILWTTPGERYRVAQRNVEWWATRPSGVSVPLEDLPGVTPDTVFTVLEERKQS